MFRIFQHCNRCLADFCQIKRADTACHGYCNTYVGIDQNRGKCCRKQGGFLHGIVIVGNKIHRILINIPEQLVTDRFQLYFCITGCGICHITGIRLTEVTLGLHIRMQQRLIAPCQTYHGLIDRTVAVRVQTHGLPDNICRLGQIACEESHLVHGIQQLSV